MSYEICILLASIRRGSSHQVIQDTHSWITQSGQKNSAHFYLYGAGRNITVYTWDDCSIISRSQFSASPEDWAMVERLFLKKMLA